ncbi:hypothetical protein B0H11DRAFT_2246673 [Mycena galericulata]|nr:hypothetical protein B0H11DRAFT_2246673 [Mycena galericulata]
MPTHVVNAHGPRTCIFFLHSAASSARSHVLLGRLYKMLSHPFVEILSIVSLPLSGPPQSWARLPCVSSYTQRLHGALMAATSLRLQHPPRCDAFGSLASPNGAYADLAQPTPRSGERTATPWCRTPALRHAAHSQSRSSFWPGSVASRLRRKTRCRHHCELPAERVHRANMCCLFHSCMGGIELVQVPTRLQVVRDGPTGYVSNFVENTIS